MPKQGRERRNCLSARVLLVALALLHMLPSTSGSDCDMCVDDKLVCQARRARRDEAYAHGLPPLPPDGPAWNVSQTQRSGWDAYLPEDRRRPGPSPLEKRADGTFPRARGLAVVKLARTGSTWLTETLNQMPTIHLQHECITYQRNCPHKNNKNNKSFKEKQKKK